MIILDKRLHYKIKTEVKKTCDEIIYFLKPPCYTELNKKDHTDVTADVESGSETGMEESSDTVTLVSRDPVTMS